MILLSTTGEVEVSRFIVGYLVRQYNARISNDTHFDDVTGNVTVDGIEFDLSKCFTPIMDRAEKKYQALYESRLVFKYKNRNQ